MDLLCKAICLIVLGCCYVGAGYAVASPPAASKAKPAVKMHAAVKHPLHTKSKTHTHSHIASKTTHRPITVHKSATVVPLAAASIAASGAHGTVSLPMPPAIVLDPVSTAPSGAGHRILSLVNHTLSHIHATSYHMGGTYFNALKGIYRLDCSSYVDHLLVQGAPSAYHSIVAWSGQRPVSWDYYKFFRSLPVGNIWHHWSAVPQVAQLRAGDIIALRQESRHKRVMGHMMVVVAEPTRDAYHADVYYVRVADSAHSGHSEDTRGRSSGIGAGTMLMKVNPLTQAPYAYAWKIGSAWKEIGVAMARPEG